MKAFRKPIALLVALLMAIIPFCGFAEAGPVRTELDDALNVPGGTLSFSDGGTEYPMQAVTVDERVCAKTTNQTVGRATSSVTLTASVAAGTVLKYDIKTSTEPTYDKFTLTVNGAVIAAHTMHGINDWTEKSYVVTEAGDFTFVFGYTKDSSVDRNEDTVWLDNIRFEEPVSVTGIELPANETVYIGTPLTLVPVISPENATIQTVAWATDNEEVATVNAAGVVTAVAQGECNITATTADGGFTATTHITVPAPVSPESVELNFTEGDLAAGSYVTNVFATVLPENAYDKTVTWESSDTSLVTVTSAGKISAMSNVSGTVVVTATTVNGLSASITINVIAPDDMPGLADFSFTPAEVDTDYTGVIAWNVVPHLRFPRSTATTSYLSTTNAVGYEFELVEGKTYDFLTYSPNGLRFDTYLNVIAPDGSYLVCDDESAGLGFGQKLDVTAPMNGTYRVLVSAYHYYGAGEYGLRVAEHPYIAPTGVEFAADSTELPIGGTERLVYSLIPANATNQNVTFTSSDESVVTVSENGIASGVAVGSAIITVTTEEGGFTDTITVNVVNRTVLFEETFDNSPNDRWVRRTGAASDTYWYFSNGAKAHGGSGGFAASDSFDEDYSASPDNWLISPAIELSGDSAVYTLQYFVSCDGFAGEHYELRLSTTDNLNASFTEVLLSETLSNTSYEARVIDLSAYKGQTIYLAWHHCDCTDVMSLLLDTVTVIGAGGETPEPVPGDVNGSGAIETGDALLVLRYMLGMETLTEEQLAAADFDGSGTVDQADALLILRAALGIGA